MKSLYITIAVMSAMSIIFIAKSTDERFAYQKTPEAPYKIGLCITATGRYIEFVDNLIKSARQYFLTKHKVTYIVFTDSVNKKEADDIVFVYQKKLGWPFDSCCRPKFYLACPLLSTFDYVFACDADMVFVNNCGEEILSERVGVLHAGFLKKRGSYEENKRSTAYVNRHEGKLYFAGGIYGGKIQEFTKINQFLSNSLDQDLAHGFIAKWHDESYLNRFFIDNPPTLILSSAYCYPEPPKTYPGLENIRPILVALNKNHNAYRK